MPSQKALVYCVNVNELENGNTKIVLIALLVILAVSMITCLLCLYCFWKTKKLLRTNPLVFNPKAVEWP